MRRNIFFPDGQPVPAIGSEFSLNDIYTHEHLECEVVEIIYSPFKDGTDVIVEIKGE